MKSCITILALLASTAFGQLTITPSSGGGEDSLGNPASDGWLLSSTAAGVRSWKDPGTLVINSIRDSIDSTKVLSFNISAFPTATTRTLTFLSGGGLSLPNLTMTGAILGADGNGTNPGYSFSGDATMGFYRSGVTFWLKSGTAGAVGIYQNFITLGVGSDNGMYSPAAGVIALTGSSNTTGGTFAAKARTPAQITADQNNYVPGGTSRYQRWSTDAARSITGLTFASAQVDGQSHVIVNIGANNIVIVHESASSTAANRFHNSTGADITIAADQEVDCWYDTATARWRVSKRGF